MNPSVLAHHPPTLEYHSHPEARALPRDHPHSLTVIGDEPARGLVVTGPAVLDRQIAATGVPVVTV
jgi:hypothetical protein